MKLGRRIAFASGKGGAGKTTLAVNLAWTMASSGRDVLYVDCDVEEPDGHLFLDPEWREKVDVNIPVPRVDDKSCDRCGRCGEICRFNAIKVLAGQVVSFPELCHSCGGCILVCPQGAISAVNRKTGHIATGISTAKPGGDTPGRLGFMMGELDIGEARAVPVISRLLDDIDDEGLVLLDSPPGTSCPMVESVRGADHVVLVAEASPFGLHDFLLASQVLAKLDRPFSVVVNRVIKGGSEEIFDYCEKEGIEILATIPAMRSVAEASSTGGIAARDLPEYREIIDGLMSRMEERRITAP